MNIGSRGFQQGFYTVSQKVVHQTHGDNFVNTEFHDSFTAGKRTKFPTNLTTMLPHYLAKFEFVVISKKNNLKIVSRLIKTETSLVIWLNIVTIFVGSVRLLPVHMREDATRQLRCQ